MHVFQRGLMMACAVLLLCGSLPAADSAEDALKTKGIRRVGDSLLLADETDLRKMLGEVSRLKRDAFNVNKELAVVEKKADEAKKLINGYTQQRRLLRAQLDKTTNVSTYNRIVTALNELGDRITLLENADFSKELKEARDKSYQAQESYLQHVLEMRKLADRIERQYIDLAADAEVTAAIEALEKETGKTYELAESRAFQSNVRSLKRLEDSVISESIKLRADGSDLYYVPTVINGKYTKELSIDSGSSLMCLPFKMAADVGATPQASDQDIVLQLADGSQVAAKLVVLPSVRVGKFTVEKVECAVMPENLPDAAAVLGMSFLRNFSFKINSETATMTMAKVNATTSASR